MLIDWFTVAAQVVNFLVLVWLLKRFLYRPILDAIDAREQRIAAALADADAKQAEAQAQRDLFERKNAAFEQQRAALLLQATDAANDARRRLLDEARKAAAVLAAKREEALRSEQKNLRAALGRRAREEVFAIARKALADLASTDLEERLAEMFLRRLDGLDGEAKARLGAALRAAAAPARLRSAFELPAAQRAAIQAALERTFSAAIPVRFETAPGLVCGIELATDGHKLGWSVDEYLDSLEQGVAALLKQKEQPATESAPAPTARASEPGPQ